MKGFLLLPGKSQEILLTHPGLEAAAVHGSIAGTFIGHQAGSVPVSGRLVKRSQRIITLIVSAVYIHTESLLRSLRVRVLQRHAQQIIVERIALRVFLYVLLEDIGHQGRVLAESVVPENGVFHSHDLGQFAACLIGGVHKEGVHLGHCFIGLSAAVKVHLRQGGIGVLNAAAACPGEKDFGLFETFSAGIHKRQPSAITIGGVGVTITAGF